MIDFIKKNIIQIFELSKFDYLLRFRRTKLGPFWNILTIFITVLLMSLVWSIIFKIDIKEYIPRLMFGFTAFIFISNTITLSVDLISDKYANELKTINISKSLRRQFSFLAKIVNPIIEIKDRSITKLFIRGALSSLKILLTFL